MKEIIQKDFEVYLGSESIEKLAETLIHKAYSKVFVLVDSNTKKYCWPIVSPYLVNYELIEIPAGEQNKTLFYAEKVWEVFQLHQADRFALLINLGGGVVSDLGGFCAATYKRGIDFINVPTSLLSMVDASIGGKLGIDFKSYKNTIGVFQHPNYIFIYPPFLETLPFEEKRNGLAELVKHALIEDKKLFSKLESIQEYQWGNSDQLIFQSLKIKAGIVKKDPFESDLRKTLNFGHTIGHAIETESLLNDSKPLKHGEAVAIGMICESYLSHKTLGLPLKDVEKIAGYFLSRFPKYNLNASDDALLNHMLNDKKNRNGLIHFSLLKKIGKAKINVQCETQFISESLEYYRNFEA